MCTWKLWKFIVLCLLHGAGTNEVQIEETHVCPGNILIFQCIVYGSQGHSTVWEGTAFSGCDNDEIILLHHRFSDEKINCTFGECNSGAITVMSTNVEGNNNSSNDSFYVSQLMVVVQPIMVGKTIECSHDNGSDSIETGNISLISNLCDTLQTVNINNSTSYSPGTGQATVTLKGTKVPIVISSSVVILFTLFFTLLLLFYGLRKKIWSISVCDTGGEASKEQSRCQVINNKVDNYIEVVKIVDNEKMGIYNQSLSNYEVLKAENITPEQGEIPACNLNNLVYTLRGHISFQWYSFGLAIGVPKQILNQLEDYTDEECLVEVLDYWLRHHPGKPTWQEVMEAKRKALATCNTNF